MFPKIVTMMVVNMIFENKFSLSRTSNLPVLIEDLGPVNMFFENMFTITKSNKHLTRAY